MTDRGHKVRSYLVLVIIFAVSFVMAFDAALKRNAAERSSVPTVEPVLPTSPSDVTATQEALETISAEHTAIAVFTQNPTLALSSTPFYAEIIANEIIRKMDAHEPPYGQGSVPTSDFSSIIESQLETVYGITWTPTATFTPPAVASTKTPTFTPAPKCVPVVSAFQPLGLSQKLTDLLHDKAIQGTGAVNSTGVEGIDAACMTPFVPIYTEFGFFLYSEISSQEISDILAQVLEVFSAFEPENAYISRIRCTVDFGFGKPDTGVQAAIRTDCQTAISAYQQELSGEALINVLGGLIRYDLETTSISTP